MTAEVVDTTTGELLPQLTAEQARTLTDEIRRTLHVGHDLIIRAFQGHAWSALGYDSWDAYCAGEFTEARMVRLDREQRREIATEMHTNGMSRRAIGSALGVDKNTIADDLAVRRGEDSPRHTDAAPVVGSDGKTYSPQTLEQRRDLAAKLREQGMSHADIADSMGVAKSTAQSLLAARKPAALTKSPSDTPRKLERIAELAGQGWSSSQIARDLDIGEERIRKLARDNGIDIGADKVLGRSRRIDSNKVAGEIVSTLDGLAIPLRLINYDDLDVAALQEWATSLNDSIRPLNRFVKQIKEMARND